MLDPKMKASEMDIRSYFAAMAMRAAPQCCGPEDEINKGIRQRWAENIIFNADALIAELNKESK